MTAARTALRTGPLLAALLLAACAAPPAPPPPPMPMPPEAPRSYVALLANDDGSTGKVVYTGPQGQVELNQPRQAAALQGPATAFVVGEQQLQRDVGAAMSAQPRQPRVFIINFEAGTTRITAQSQALLPQVVQEVRSRPGADLSIIGHTDTKGGAALNVTLSLRRAEQVAQLLKDATSAAAATEIGSHGEGNLLVPTPDDTNEPRNRRVEITVR